MTRTSGLLERAMSTRRPDARFARLSDGMILLQNSLAVAVRDKFPVSDWLQCCAIQYR